MRKLLGNPIYFRILQMLTHIMIKQTFIWNNCYCLKHSYHVQYPSVSVQSVSTVLNLNIGKVGEQERPIRFTLLTVSERLKAFFV
jgi:hypothetical protein